MFEVNNASVAVSDLEKSQALIAELEAKLETAQARIAELAQKVASVRSYIQSSINNEEWTPEELSEIFWEELAERLDLDLAQTQQVEVTFTITYSGTVTIPKGADVDDLQIDDLPSWPEVSAKGFGVVESYVSHDDTEVSAY